MKTLFPVCLFCFLSGILFAGVERFLKPVQINSLGHTEKSKRNALIRSSLIHDRMPLNHVSSPRVVITDHDIERLLSESIQHRFQASGDVMVKLTSEWIPFHSKPGYILKLTDVSPDELTASSFARFSLWVAGEKINDFSFPIRISQMRDIYVTSRSLPFGTKLNAQDFKLQRADVLRQHANSVPASIKLASFQLDSYLPANTPLKWNNVSKANLIKKGQVVDVFASGNGIYVTMKGLALEDGSADSLVKVRNLSSDKEFHAKVLSENSVKVSL